MDAAGSVERGNAETGINNPDIPGLIRKAVASVNKKDSAAKLTRRRLAAALKKIPIGQAREYISAIALAENSSASVLRQATLQAALLDAFTFEKLTSGLAAAIVERNAAPAEIQRLSDDLSDPAKRKALLQSITENDIPFSMVPAKGKLSQAIIVISPFALQPSITQQQAAQKEAWYSIGIFAHSLLQYHGFVLDSWQATANNARQNGLDLSQYLQTEQGKQDFDKLVKFVKINQTYRQLQEQPEKEAHLTPEAVLADLNVLQGSLIKHPGYDAEILMLFFTDRNNPYQTAVGQRVHQAAVRYREPFVVTDIFLQPFGQGT